MRISRQSSILFITIPVFIFCLFLASGYGWGFFAHKQINRRAVATLPAELRPFFEQHKEFLSEHAVDPDLWRRKDAKEGVRHYIDIDMYGRYPFAELPRDYDKALQKFGADTLRQRGVAPWRVVTTFEALVASMKRAEVDSILIHAAALGHYVSDLHMPLHTVENYDGQLSGNKGVHRRFERDLVEAYWDSLSLTVLPARLIPDPLDFIFAVVMQSYPLHQDILQADSRAKVPDKEYVGAADYDAAYLAAFYRGCGKIAEQRIADAATAVGSFWYTAWVKAGKPDLGERVAK